MRRAAAGTAVLLLACALPGAPVAERPRTLRIVPPRPVAELRLDIPYATADNFLSTPVYEEARALASTTR